MKLCLPISLARVVKGWRTRVQVSGQNYVLIKKNIRVLGQNYLLIKKKHEALFVVMEDKYS